MQGRLRQYSGLLATVVTTLAAGLCLFFSLSAGGVFAQFGIYFLATRANAIFLAGVSVLIFMLYPARSGAHRDKLPWYDVLLILGSLGGNLYIAVNALALQKSLALTASPLQMALGFITIFTLFEALRRTTGWAIVIITAFFILYAKFAYLLPGPLGAYKISWGRLMLDVYLSVEGIYGSLVGLASNIIIIFICFGVFLVATGADKWFSNLAMALVGMFRGGPAKVAVVASSLFGTISGSPVANVVVDGAITISMMKRLGYRPDLAGAIETVASTGGLIMPPVMGAVAFIMADSLGVSYATIAIAAAIPAILYYAALFVQIDLHAARTGLKGQPRSELPELLPILKQGWQYALPVVLLIVFLLVLRYPAPMAAIYAILVIVVVSMFSKETRLNAGKIITALAEATKSTLLVGILLGICGVFMALLSLTGFGPRISAGLVTLSGGQMLPLLLLTAAVCYIMGMGVSITASYLVLSTLVVPALANLGLPDIVAHFYILYWGLSTFFTPPYAPAAFAASAISGASPFRTGFQAMRLGIIVFIVPFIFVYNPVLLMIGSPAQIALATVTALIGIVGVGAALEGYLFTQANWLQRILFGAAGIAMIVPGLWTDIAGATVFAAVVFWQRQQKGRPLKSLAEVRDK